MRNKLLTIALATALLSGCAAESNNDTPSDNSVNVDADTLRTDSLQPQKAISNIAVDTSHFEYEDGVLRLTWKMLTDVVFFQMSTVKKCKPMSPTLPSGLSYRLLRGVKS
jgi:hypothetical protein